MQDIIIRTAFRSGRITMNRPDTLNALTHGMGLAIEEALDDWRSNPRITQVVIDAAGDRAFCAGGDIADLYAKGRAGDFSFGQKFWADEYRLNAKIFNYPKPIVSLLQGFTMGGGVGIGCHGSHRIVGETSQIAMPECGIGLIPDVGGTLMLARAPGRLGEFLGLTGTRMSAADAIYAGFADHFVPQDRWPDLISVLESQDVLKTIPEFETEAGASQLEDQQQQIDRLFAVGQLEDIRQSLQMSGNDFANKANKAISRNAPLSMAATCDVLRRLRDSGSTRIEDALRLEYRFTYRAMEQGDLLEGIRAAIIDKDKSPNWKYADGTVPSEAVEAMLRPLGDAALQLEDTQ